MKFLILSLAVVVGYACVKWEDKPGKSYTGFAVHKADITLDQCKEYCAELLSCKGITWSESFLKDDCNVYEKGALLISSLTGWDSYQTDRSGCPMDCVLGVVPVARDCTEACGTLTQPITTPQQLSGKPCGTQEKYVCKDGDGDCSKGKSGPKVTVTVNEFSICVSYTMTVDGKDVSLQEQSDFKGTCGLKADVAQRVQKDLTKSTKLRDAQVKVGECAFAGKQCFLKTIDTTDLPADCCMSTMQGMPAGVSDCSRVPELSETPVKGCAKGEKLAEKCSAEVLKEKEKIPEKVKAHGGDCSPMIQIGLDILAGKIAAEAEVKKAMCTCGGVLPEEELKKFDCADETDENFYQTVTAMKCSGTALWAFVAVALSAVLF